MSNLELLLQLVPLLLDVPLARPPLQELLQVLLLLIIRGVYSSIVDERNESGLGGKTAGPGLHGNVQEFVRRV